MSPETVPEPRPRFHPEVRLPTPASSHEPARPAVERGDEFPGDATSLLYERIKGTHELTAGEEPPTAGLRVLPSPLATSTRVIVMEGRVGPGDVASLCGRARESLEGCEVSSVICDVGALATSDLAAIEALVRLQLVTRRLGCGIRVRRASPDLRDLLRLTGLGAAVPLLE